jgi:hypothetical protein
VRIGTLNYDTSIELLGDLENIDVDTGMDSWDATGELNFHGSEVRLFKLHGSIDWHMTRHVSVQADDPLLPFERVSRQKSVIAAEPALIFGAGNKLRAGGPYLALFHRFEESLEDNDALLIVGYSFRDDHVNAAIVKWMNAQFDRRVVILDKSANRFKEFVPPSQQTLGHLLASKKVRVQLVESSTAEGLEDAITLAVGRQVFRPPSREI